MRLWGVFVGILFLFGCRTDNLLQLSAGRLVIENRNESSIAVNQERRIGLGALRAAVGDLKFFLYLDNTRSLTFPSTYRGDPFEVVVGFSSLRDGWFLNGISGRIETPTKVLMPIAIEYLSSPCITSYKYPVVSGSVIDMPIKIAKRVSNDVGAQGGVLEKPKQERGVYDPTIRTCLRFRYNEEVKPDLTFSLVIGDISNKEIGAAMPIRFEFAPSLYHAYGY